MSPSASVFVESGEEKNIKKRLNAVVRCAINRYLSIELIDELEEVVILVFRF